MKKKIVIMMVLLLAVVGAKAQEVENPVGRFSVIPRIGVSLANWSGLTLETLDGTSLESKYQAGFMGGADVEYRMVRAWVLRWVLIMPDRVCVSQTAS